MLQWNSVCLVRFCMTCGSVSLNASPCDLCTDLVNEELPAVLIGVQHAGLLDLVTHGVAERLLVLRGEQVRNVTRAQQVVDVHLGRERRHRVSGEWWGHAEECDQSLVSKWLMYAWWEKSYIADRDRGRS